MQGNIQFVVRQRRNTNHIRREKCTDCGADDSSDDPDDEKTTGDNNTNNIEKDNTTADKEIPKAGSFARTGVFAIIILAGAVGLVKSIKYRNIK